MNCPCYLMLTVSTNYLKKEVGSEFFDCYCDVTIDIEGTIVIC